MSVIMVWVGFKYFLSDRVGSCQAVSSDDEGDDTHGSILMFENRKGGCRCEMSA